MRAKILRTAAEHFECAEADLMLMDGKVAIKGVPQRDIALGALAALANPLRGAVQPGTEPGLEATAYFGPAKGATAAGARNNRRHRSGDHGITHPKIRRGA